MNLTNTCPNYTDRNTINTEFQLFLQNILNGISKIPEETLTNIKTELRFSCEKDCNKKTPSKYKKDTSNLSKNSNIIVLKQDKGRGVVIMKTFYHHYLRPWQRLRFLRVLMFL